MKKWILSLWLVLPALAVAYHYGPGQRGLVMDDVGLMVQAANHYSNQQDWTKTIELCDQALQTLPEEDLVLRRKVTLEKAKAQMMASQLPNAREALVGLMDEISKDPSVAEDFKNDVRQALASSEFYLTWLMRLEGLGRQDWEPHIESARQHYKLLAESASDAKKPQVALQRKKDLESTIRLARMDLGDLQGLPLPSQ